MAVLLIVLVLQSYERTKRFVQKPQSFRVLGLCTIILIPFIIYGQYDYTILDQGISNLELVVSLDPNETYVTPQLSNWGSEIHLDVFISYYSSGFFSIFIRDENRPDVLHPIEGWDESTYLVWFPYRYTSFMVPAVWTIVFQNQNENGTCDASVFIAITEDIDLINPPWAGEVHIAERRVMFQNYAALALLLSLWFWIPISNYKREEKPNGPKDGSINHQQPNLDDTIQ
ncbi:MAG: hypothetical protein ACW97G_14950 [Candidatus Thorarchaeota archaeon]|jgi:hypothetical protein